MKIALVLVFSVFLLSPVTKVFAETTLKAELDKVSITTDEMLTYKLTLASTEKKIPAFKVPGFQNLAIVSQAQSSTVSFQKGGMQSILVYVFILLPKAAGKFKIEPAQVIVNGKVYASQGFQIEVKQGVVRVPQEPGSEIPDSDQPKYSL